MNQDEWIRDLIWMTKLPHYLVLDDWVLVHAGLEPGKSLDEQNERQLLWIRDEFHSSKKPVDLKRAVVFGHSITH